MSKGNIIWTPVFPGLSAELLPTESLSTIVAPFIKVDALMSLLALRRSDQLSVIARWRPEELIRGVSDLEIYPLLKSEGIPLYIHESIHLKLLLFDSDRALCSSANITAKGLGMGTSANIEAGVLVDMAFRDFLELQKIRNNSRVVTDEIYNAYTKCISDYEYVEAVFPQVILPEIPDQTYMLSMLPASEKPQDVCDYYFRSKSESFSKEVKHRAIHDLCTYKTPQGLSREELGSHLEIGFHSNSFVQGVVEYLRRERTLRFGAVNEFIYRTCKDVPLPYRWEIKSTTANLYNWLAFYFDEIWWERPRHSQVIHWKETG